LLSPPKLNSFVAQSLKMKYIQSCQSIDLGALSTSVDFSHRAPVEKAAKPPQACHLKLLIKAWSKRIQTASSHKAEFRLTWIFAQLGDSVSPHFSFVIPIWLLFQPAVDTSTNSISQSVSPTISHRVLRLTLSDSDSLPG